MLFSPADGSRSAKNSGLSAHLNPGRSRSWSKFAVTTITAVAVVIGAGGCSIRLETATPSELVPTTNELARQAMVNDLELLNADVAGALALGQSKKTTKVLDTVQERTTAREEAIGGIYVSGLPDVGGEIATTEPDPELTPTGVSGEEQLQATITRLLDSSARVRSSLDIAEDTGLARALASIAIGQTIEARSLAKTVGAEVTMPQSLTAQTWTSDAPNLDESTLLALAASEDYAGYAFEVAAAMSSTDSRAQKLTLARSHRDAAEELVILAGVNGTSQDPRRSAYALPLELDADKYVATPEELTALLQSLETSLAQDYFTLIGDVEPTERALLFDKALARALDAKTLAAKLDAKFPLMENPQDISAS